MHLDDSNQNGVVGIEMKQHEQYEQTYEQQTYDQQTFKSQRPSMQFQQSQSHDILPAPEEMLILQQQDNSK